MSPFEIIMLACFGSAWPFSIARSWKSRTTKGKSIGFLIIILIGYTSGIVHKVFYSWDKVVLLYVLNLLMVSIDTVIYFRNKSIDQEAAAKNL
jgi:cyanate permease